MNKIGEVAIRTGLDFLAASASADRNGEPFDMAGYDGVLMIFKFADIAAGATTSVKAQQGALANMADGADLEGTGIVVAADDDNQIFIIDLYQPIERYVRGVVDKDGANNTNECLIYIGYGADQRPVNNNVADEVTSEFHASPAEGVA